MVPCVQDTCLCRRIRPHVVPNITILTPGILLDGEKNDFDWRVFCVSCVYTKFHMSGYLFVYICMHVTHSNKILVNKPVTTFPMNTRECSSVRPRNKMGHVSTDNMCMSVKKRYSPVCENKNHRTKVLLWSWMDSQRDCGFDHVENHDGIGRA